MQRDHWGATRQPTIVDSVMLTGQRTRAPSCAVVRQAHAMVSGRNSQNSWNKSSFRIFYSSLSLSLLEVDSFKIQVNMFSRWRWILPGQTYLFLPPLTTDFNFFHLLFYDVYVTFIFKIGKQSPHSFLLEAGKEKIRTPSWSYLCMGINLSVSHQLIKMFFKSKKKKVKWILQIYFIESNISEVLLF